MTRLEQQMEFIKEVDKLKEIGRQTYISNGSRKENDAEHSWHLAIMCLLLKEYAEKEVDLLKTISMVLIHDIVEIDAGDTYAYDDVGNQSKRERELQAANRIFNLLPNDQAITMRNLWDEFEARTTKEAKFAHAVDRIQPTMLNDASDGKAWKEHDVTISQILNRNTELNKDVPILWDYCVQHYINPNVKNKSIIEDRQFDYTNYEKSITELDLQLFAQGKHNSIHEKLGAHLVTIQHVKGIHFAVWAPHAKSVSVVGNFNDWNEKKHVMSKRGQTGIYEIFVPYMGEDELYKFYIITEDNNVLYKADPYSYYAELRPATASITTNLEKYQWSDQNWIAKKRALNRTQLQKEAINIYEVHLGSFMQKEDCSFFSYREIAGRLVTYLREMRYTHVELMGILEHPFDGSWGYQVSSYYAPTSRYGKPEDFMFLIDLLHENEIGVILDWVPGHFLKDEHALGRFDGKPLYEYKDERKGEHFEWGTYVFDYTKPEVISFLIGNALFWIEKYHIDGLRVDAVSSMLYLDYCRNPGEWIPNRNGGRENLEVVAFFQALNKLMEQRNPGTLMIAEESTAWPNVTKSVEKGGLGFTHKWNMGWMNDFLQYMKLDGNNRKYEHQKLTFSMMYAYSENFILALSHDEVVHEKKTLLNKMPGNEEEKFANLRLTYGFMYGHPGKKLLFMGQDFAQKREWCETRSLDWELLQIEKHKKLHHYIKDLNQLYLLYPCMYELDYNPKGFQWINCNETEGSIVSFIRRSMDSNNELIFVFHFGKEAKNNYQLGVPKQGNYKVILDSNNIAYGGKEQQMDKIYCSTQSPCDGYGNSLSFVLHPYSCMIFCRL